MRRLWLVLAGCSGVAAIVAGCPAEAPPVRAPAPAEAVKAEPPPPEPVNAYVLADPDTLAKGFVLALDGGAIGALLDGARIVAKGAEITVATDITGGALARVERLPAWLGGGFLFQTRSALYLSETFDGPLRPLASFPDRITRISFGPKSALVRSSDGQRAAIELPKGTPAPLFPVGLADVAALADGRAAALTYGSRALVSVDRGEHWSDVTAGLGAPPTGLLARGGELYVSDVAGDFHRVEPTGKLTDVDAPPAAPVEHLRPREGGWHGSEAPLVAAVRRGAKLDESTALVATGGDVARVDLRSGAVKILAAGRLPPDLPCEALRAGEEVIAVCAASNRPSIVVSHLAEGSPRIERTFPADGPYYASDDGALAFGGSCDGAHQKLVVCVRDLHGEWQEHAVEPAPDAGVTDAGRPIQDADAGPPPPDPASITRWIPRADGRPLALTGGKVLGTIDPVAGIARAWRKGDGERAFSNDLIHAAGGHESGVIVDRRWSATEGGSLRGWMDGGEEVRVSAAGDVERTAFRYPRAFLSAELGFALDGEGRAYQSTDRGDTWAEVKAPPLPKALRSASPLRCSAVGCDLGTFLRLGWDAAPPLLPASAPEPPPKLAAPPRFPAEPPREIVCTTAGDEHFLGLGLSSTSPEDFGFGAHRVPVSGEVRDLPIAYKRRFFSRGLLHPVMGLATADEPRAARALVHGFAAEFFTPDGPLKSALDGINVLGPRRGGDAFRRDIVFLEPFDPEGAARNAGFTLRDLTATSVGAGMPLSQLYASEGPDVDAVLPILPADPAGATGLCFTMLSQAGQVLGTVTGGSSPRLKIAGLRVDSTAPSAESAVELGGGDVAVLEVNGTGDGEILKLSATGLSPLVSLPMSPETPPNPDALAVGPGGALGIVRMPSGGEPPSTRDPALLLPLGGGAAPFALAPWSTLVAASDPACKADPGGYRAIVQTAGTWVRIHGGRPARDGTTGAMLARVRWSAARVCLEAIEVPDGGKQMQSGEEIEMVTAVRFTGKPAAGRLGVTAGAEVRQALSCALAP